MNQIASPSSGATCWGVGTVVSAIGSSPALLVVGAALGVRTPDLVAPELLRDATSRLGGRLAWRKEARSSAPGVPGNTRPVAPRASRRNAAGWEGDGRGSTPNP